MPLRLAGCTVRRMRWKKPCCFGKNVSGGGWKFWLRAMGLKRRWRAAKGAESRGYETAWGSAACCRAESSQMSEFRLSPEAEAEVQISRGTTVLEHLGASRERRLATGGRFPTFYEKALCVKQKILGFYLPQFGPCHSADLSLSGPGGWGCQGRAGFARRSEPLTTPPVRPYPRCEAEWQVCRPVWLSEFHDYDALEFPRI